MKDFEPVFDLIAEALKTNTYINAAIDGSSGSGKSMLARLLGEEFDCNIFHMDDFFLTPEMRTPGRFAEVGGNIDYHRFKTQVIDKLSEDAFSYEKYDCHTDTFTLPCPMSKKKLNIIEGVYSMHPLFRDAYRLKICLTVNEETQKKRILKRSGAEMLKRFLSEWIPLENLYFEKTNIFEESDVVIDTSYFN